MIEYTVRFRREALQQLADLRDYIARATSLDRAIRFVDEIVAHCEQLAVFPLRGTARDDIRPGLRTTGFRRRVVIAYAVLDEKITIVGIFYGGRDYESILSKPQT